MAYTQQIEEITLFGTEVTEVKKNDDLQNAHYIVMDRGDVSFAGTFKMVQEFCHYDEKTVQNRIAETAKEEKFYVDNIDHIIAKVEAVEKAGDFKKLKRFKRALATFEKKKNPNNLHNRIFFNNDPDFVALEREAATIYASLPLKKNKENKPYVRQLSLAYAALNLAEENETLLDLSIRYEISTEYLEESNNSRLFMPA